MSLCSIAGSVTFVTMSMLSFHSFCEKQTMRQFVQSHLIVTWALRLGMFLFIRVLKAGEDRRFRVAKEKPMVFLKFWTLQGLWVYICLLPTLMLNESTRNPPLGPQDYIGWGLWGLGFVIETVADFQKSMFRSNRENKDKFIKTGLWSISRHPNYFGEIMLWAGLYISASSVFRGWQYLAVLCPVAIHLLITKLSGIPLLEKAADKKWGNLEEYKRYKENTPIFVPFWR